MKKNKGLFIFFGVSISALALYIFYFHDKYFSKEAKERIKVDKFKKLTQEISSVITETANIMKEAYKDPEFVWGKPLPKKYQDQLDALQTSKAYDEYQEGLKKSINFTKNDKGIYCIQPPCF